MPSVDTSLTINTFLRAKPSNTHEQVLLLFSREVLLLGRLPIPTPVRIQGIRRELGFVDTCEAYARTGTARSFPKTDEAGLALPRWGKDPIAYQW